MSALKAEDLKDVLRYVNAGWIYKDIAKELSVGTIKLTATDISRFLIKHGHRKIKPYKKGEKMNSFTLPTDARELEEFMNKTRARIPEQSPIRKLERIVEKYRFVWHMEMLAKGFAVEKIKEMQKEIES